LSIVPVSLIPTNNLKNNKEKALVLFLTPLALYTSLTSHFIQEAV